MPPIVFAALVLGGLVLAAPALAGGVRIVGVDTSGYPSLRVGVVAPLGTPQPELLEDGVPVVGLRAVSHGAKTVVLAIDCSQSMAGRPLADATAAARAFIASTTAADRIGVIAVGKQARPLTSFSDSKGAATAALAHLAVDGQPGTALWDAVVLGSDELARQPVGGRVIIVVTDGRDVSSSASFEDAVAAAHRAGAAVYTVGIASPDATPGPLRELAAQTGGSFHSGSYGQLGAVYASISRVLVRTWELRFPTVARPGERMRLTAVVSGVGRDQLAVALIGLGADTAPTAPKESLLPRADWRSPLAAVGLAATVGLLVLVACLLLLSPRPGQWVADRLEPYLGGIRKETKARRRRDRQGLFRRILVVTESALANVKQFRAVERLLERAALPLRASELLYVSCGTGFLLALFAALLSGSTFVTVLALAVGLALPLLFVLAKARTRIKAFDNQLPDLLTTIAASLKAGHSFRHAIQSVAEEAAEPTATEFKRVLSETQLGRSIDDALADMAARVGSRNLSFVVIAVTIQRQIGGSLAGLFDVVADTVRQRQQFARKIRGLTAMGRMSAYVLAGLPFVVALAITLINPSYMSLLYHSQAGHELIFVGLVLMTIGTVILTKMVSFKG
jgi:tight adherence protein B